MLNFYLVIIIITFKHYTQLSLGGNDNYTQTMLNFHLVIIILLVVDNVDDYYGFTLKKGLRMNFGPLIKFSHQTNATSQVHVTMVLILYLLLVVIIYFTIFMISFCLKIRFMATLTLTFKYFLDNLSTQNFSHDFKIRFVDISRWE